jgi:hypothetical protein
LSVPAGSVLLDAVGNDQTSTPVVIGSNTEILKGNDGTALVGYGLSYQAGSGGSISNDWQLNVSRVWFDQAIIINPQPTSYMPPVATLALSGVTGSPVRGTLVTPQTP